MAGCGRSSFGQVVQKPVPTSGFGAFSETPLLLPGRPILTALVKADKEAGKNLSANPCLESRNEII